MQYMPGTRRVIWCGALLCERCRNVGLCVRLSFCASRIGLYFVVCCSSWKSENIFFKIEGSYAKMGPANNQ